jgi:hypothetical protein
MDRRSSVAGARAQLPSILVTSVRPSFDDAYRAFVKAHPLAEVGLDRDFVVSVRDRSTG